MKITKKTQLFLLFFLTICLPLVGLLHSGLPVTDDGQDHVARIANFYQSLSEGNIVPRWAANLNWGYGHPILMFLYPLPSYMASLFHFIGFSFVDSTKLVFGLTFVASALAMYIWMRRPFGEKAAIVGGLLYVFAPYRFVDFYVRGALGEHVAFVFPPLVLYFLYHLARCEKNSHRLLWNAIGTSLSLAALILSHNAIAIMFFPVIVAYMVYLWAYEVKQKEVFVLSCATALVFGFSLSAFFWIPAYFEGKYTLRDIVTAGEALQRFVPWTWFVYSPWTFGVGKELTKQLGLIQWLGILASIWFIKKTKDSPIRTMVISLLVLLLGSFFIMTSTSEVIWQKITLLQKFQFPWRFLSISVFAAAVAGGIVVASISDLKKSGNFLYAAICALSIILTFYMWHPRAYQIKDSTFYTGIYSGTTDTGESSPIWSVRFMEHVPDKPVDIISGSAVVTPLKRTSTLHEYEIAADVPVQAVENTLYFPGWKIYIDGNPTTIEFQDPNYRGLMTFHIPVGAHNVRVVFGNTQLRKYSDIISLASFIVLVVVGSSGLLWKRKE